MSTVKSQSSRHRDCLRAELARLRQLDKAERHIQPIPGCLAHADDVKDGIIDTARHIGRKPTLSELEGDTDNVDD